MADNRLVYPENARSPGYKAQLEEIAATGVCPFCIEHLPRWKSKPIIRKGNFWLVTPVDWAYDGVSGHFMLIARAHVAGMQQLRPEAVAELFGLVAWLKENFALRHSTFLWREGGPETGQTVAHLHAQLVSAGDQPILTRIG